MMKSKLTEEKKKSVIMMNLKYEIRRPGCTTQHTKLEDKTVQSKTHSHDS